MSRIKSVFSSGEGAVKTINYSEELVEEMVENLVKKLRGKRRAKKEKEIARN